jgi:hypothetical protein
MEGFWTVQFTGVQGLGCGVITLMKGQVFGGDSSFLYSGTYGQNGSVLHAHVHVKRYAPGLQSVMGRDEFELELTGSRQGGTINATGTVPGTPFRLEATLTKRSQLPARI